MQDKEKSRLKSLRLDILEAIVVEPPGIVLLNLLENLAAKEYAGRKFSRDTIRRRVMELGAEGYLRIKNKAVIYPTEKCKKLVGRTQPPVKPEADIHE